MECECAEDAHCHVRGAQGKMSLHSPPPCCQRVCTRNGTHNAAQSCIHSPAQLPCQSTGYFPHYAILIHRPRSALTRQYVLCTRFCDSESPTLLQCSFLNFESAGECCAAPRSQSSRESIRSPSHSVARPLPTRLHHTSVSVC